MQPLTIKINEYGDRTIRFVENAIVNQLLKESQDRGFGLNHLAHQDFTQTDWEQFYQLIGYSVCGYHELSMVSDISAINASEEARKIFPGFKGCRECGCKIHRGIEQE